MKTRLHLLAIPALLSVLTLPAFALYDLPDVRLDGTSGANTWYVSGDTNEIWPGGLGYSAGTGNPVLTWTLGSSGKYNYMVATFDAVTLANVGDSLVLSWQITPGGSDAFRNADGALRVGLFNSGGNQISGNVNGATDARFNNDTGYAALYAPNAASGANSKFFRRGGGNDNLWSGRTEIAGSPTLASPGTGVITGSLTLKLIEGGLLITSVINGGAGQSVTTASNLVTTFDTLSFFATSGKAGSTLTFSELSVTYVPAVPEPSACALLAGTILLAFAVIRRNRRMSLKSVISKRIL
ncbi:MAG: PEP-CTERM sorting domain-containing protein [Opitutaceae bacterium]|jgi:hypothetical protein|nr:PEP-CTERM sorting domain-containing protein [Opitutaceae bacterium]